MSMARPPWVVNAHDHLQEVDWRGLCKIGASSVPPLFYERCLIFGAARFCIVQAAKAFHSRRSSSQATFPKMRGRHEKRKTVSDRRTARSYGIARRHERSRRT